MASSSLQCGLLTSSSSLSFSDAVSGSRVCEALKSYSKADMSPRQLIVKAASGTKVLKQLKVLADGDKTGTVRTKVVDTNNKQVKLLSRVQELRLLSKAEKAGLLSLAEKFGLSLGTIEKLGLLSKAEQFGVLSAAADPSTPKSLFTVAAALFLAGPALVYIIPEDNIAEVLGQIVLASVTVLGGAAAFGGSKLIGSLQSK